MYWVKKNGGVISVYVSILLSVASMIVATTLLRLRNEKERSLTIEETHRHHLAYLESIYYIRNEIYDGYYSKLMYESGDFAIEIAFDKKNQIARLILSRNEEVRVHGFLYDKECRCIVRTYEEDEMLEMDFSELEDDESENDEITVE